MNPNRVKSGYTSLRNGHYDDIGEDSLTETMEMLQCVADNTDTTLNQVINVYGSASLNRLTEVLLDSGDAFDKISDGLREWTRSGKALRLMLCGDTMADEVRIQVCTED